MDKTLLQKDTLSIITASITLVYLIGLIIITSLQIRSIIDKQEININKTILLIAVGILYIIFGLAIFNILEIL